MDISEIPLEKKREYAVRIGLAKRSLLSTHSFFGQLLSYMRFSIDTEAETAYTDGERIVFGTTFLDAISDSELKFVLMHEVMHVVLQHCFRMKERDREIFNIAADIVVNSNIMHENGDDQNAITIYYNNEKIESIHKTPGGEEGYLYTAEEVYDMLISQTPSNTANGPGEGNSSGDGSSCSSDPNDEAIREIVRRIMRKQSGSVKEGDENAALWDDHSKWTLDNSRENTEVWTKRFIDVCKTIEIREASCSVGGLPGFAARIYKNLTDPQLDWRKILNDFIQQDFFDYSFSPPDKRFSESPFFLPDYNISDENGSVRDILFMVDTSGSISDDMITAAYSEIKGAIDQFDGRLCGYLGFFDAVVFEPKPFESVKDVLSVKPLGGGGTEFDIIFHYVNKEMKDNPPAAIIILTDGYGEFPKQSIANDIPVLWLINNDEVTPSWGKVARISV